MSHIVKVLCSILLLFAITGCSEDDTQSRIVLGTSEEMLELNNLQYQLPFVVQVTDTEGNPAVGVSVKFRLLPLGFIKGNYVATDTDNDAQGEPDRWVAVPSTPDECASEDININGSLDAGEDFDGDGVLDPRNAATIIQHPDEFPTILPGTSTLITDTDGFGYLTVTFPKSEGSWVRMQMIAEASDGLPGNAVTHTFLLPVLLQDVNDINTAPPGGSTESPYGSADTCDNPD